MMKSDSAIIIKSKDFALRVIKLYTYLKKEKKEYVLSKQLLRSGTSVGANIRESIYAQSGADFVHKLSISLKEACESEYWLELLEESNFVSANQISDLKEESVELQKLLTSIIKTKKSKLKNGGK